MSLPSLPPHACALVAPLYSTSEQALQVPLSDLQSNTSELNWNKQLRCVVEMALCQGENTQIQAEQLKSRIAPLFDNKRYDLLPLKIKGCFLTPDGSVRIGLKHAHDIMLNKLHCLFIENTRECGLTLVDFRPYIEIGSLKPGHTSTEVAARIDAFSAQIKSLPLMFVRVPTFRCTLLEEKKETHTHYEILCSHGLFFLSIRKNRFHELSLPLSWKEKHRWDSLDSDQRQELYKLGLKIVLSNGWDNLEELDNSIEELLFKPVSLIDQKNFDKLCSCSSGQAREIFAVIRAIPENIRNRNCNDGSDIIYRIADALRGIADRQEREECIDMVDSLLEGEDKQLAWSRVWLLETIVDIPRADRKAVLQLAKLLLEKNSDASYREKISEAVAKLVSTKQEDTIGRILPLLEGIDYTLLASGTGVADLLELGTILSPEKIEKIASLPLLAQFTDALYRERCVQALAPLTLSQIEKFAQIVTPFSEKLSSEGGKGYFISALAPLPLEKVPTVARAIEMLWEKKLCDQYVVVSFAQTLQRISAGQEEAVCQRFASSYWSKMKPKEKYELLEQVVNALPQEPVVEQREEIRHPEQPLPHPSDLEIQVDYFRELMAKAPGLAGDKLDQLPEEQREALYAILFS